MSISDEAFREAFKPLYIPPHYEPGYTNQDKVIYALAQIGEGTAQQVANKLQELDNTADTVRYEAIAASILTGLFAKGLVNGHDTAGGIHYNLSKVIQANDGAVNPDLLAPGLD